MSERKGLKNRGYEAEDVEDRRSAVEEFTGAKMTTVSKFGFEPPCASKNIENMIGATQIPLGFAGPVHIDGGDAKGDFLVPLATTEGALVASISRGMSVITKSGGAKARIFGDAMTRAPVLRTEGLEHCIEVMRWVDENEELLKKAVAGTTSHGSLIRIEKFPDGRNLYLRLSFSTGDAMGMNMATIASEAVCREIEKATGATMVSVSGNMCSDKKPAAINLIEGRGKTAVAEALIPKGLVSMRRASLKASTEYLEMLYHPPKGMVILPASEEMLMMRPWRLARIPGRTSWVRRAIAKTLTSIWRLASSIGTVSMAPRLPYPALFMRMSMRPSFSRMACTPA